MFSKPEFQAWGKKSVVLFASVMTKIEDRKDDELLKVYEFRGFPSMAYLDSEGEVVTKKVGRDLASMRTIATYAPVYKELKPKVDAGEAVDKNQWFLARIGMGELKLAEAKKEFAGLTLGAADAKRVAKQIFSMEMNDLLQQLRSKSLELAGAGDAVYGFYKQGKTLGADAPLAAFYDQMLVMGAVKAKDAKAFFSAYPRVKEGMTKQLKSLEAQKIRYKDNERAQTYFDRNIKSTTKQLDKLESDAKALGGDKQGKG